MCVDLQSSAGVERVACDKRECAVRTQMPPGTMSHYNNCLVSTSGTAREQRNTEDDFERLRVAVNTLHASGWYHGAMNYAEAKRKLRHSDIGTFLVRDSSASNYLFTLSVKTTRGTTSVRIDYEYGKFKLDSEAAIRNTAPSYDCVVKLVHHYLKLSEASDGNGNKDKAKCQQQQQKSIEGDSSGQIVWLEPCGRRDLVAKISKPLRSYVPGLQHLCRVSLNRYVEPRHQAELPLPGKLKAYLKQYPFEQ